MEPLVALLERMIELLTATSVDTAQVNDKLSSVLHVIVMVTLAAVTVVLVRSALRAWARADAARLRSETWLHDKAA